MTLSLRGVSTGHISWHSQMTHWLTLVNAFVHSTILYIRDSHYSVVIMATMASQFNGVSIARSTVCSGTDQRKHQSFAPLAFVRGIHRSQRASNAENISISWRHHAFTKSQNNHKIGAWRSRQNGEGAQWQAFASHAYLPVFNKYPNIGTY